MHAYKRELATVFRDDWKVDGVKEIKMNVLCCFILDLMQLPQAVFSCKFPVSVTSKLLFYRRMLLANGYSL